MHVMNACLAQKAPAERFDNNTKSVLKFILSFDLNEFSVNLIIQYLITSPP